MRSALDVDADAWSRLTLSGQGEHFDGWWAGALKERDAGQRIPFAVRRLSDATTGS